MHCCWVTKTFKCLQQPSSPREQLMHAGFRLPDEQQKIWDEILRQATPPKPAKGAAQNGKRKRKREASVIEVSDNEESALKPEVVEDEGDSVIEELSGASAQGDTYLNVR